MTDTTSILSADTTTSEPPTLIEEDGVGLSDPELSRDRRKMLDLVNRLHNTGVNTDMDLPMIAVIGSQSAGKSSLIESISGIKLPRAAGTCTRCPTECKLSHSSDPWRCIVKLHITSDPNGTPCAVRNLAFGDPITDKAGVEERIRRAQRAILNPSTDYIQFLHGDDADAEHTELSFSKNCVSLEISGRDVADLSFIDLPGLIASVGSTGNITDIELVKSLVSSYITKPSCVILLTVTCETDFENQGAHQLAKTHDPEGRRTVGVLTKPDRIPPGEEKSWQKFIKNDEEALFNGWYCVKQPGSQTLERGISWDEARREETEFFSSTEPWSSLAPAYQKKLCTSNLTDRLSTILSELISKRLPEVRNEIYTILRNTEEEMRTLPKAPSNDPIGEVLHVLSNFTRALSQRLEGTPEEDGLLQTIRPYQDKFQHAIRATAPNFQPWRSDRTDRVLPKASFLANEEGHAADEAEESTAAALSPKIYLDEVLNRAQKARTRELPDNYPFVVQKVYITQFTRMWYQPAMDLLEQIYAILKKDLSNTIKQHFAQMGRGNAQQMVTSIVNEHLDRAAATTKEKIEWLLQLEKSPTTLNDHYYSDYKDKFLSFYKGLLRGGDDLSKKLEDYKAPTSNYSSPFQIAVAKVTSGLSEMGITAKPTDIPKMLPIDPMEPALAIMAGVRAYFQVSYKRFADLVPMAIDYEIIAEFGDTIEQVLRTELQITGPEAHDRCRTLVQELGSVASRREELQKKMDRLHTASAELRTLGL
ncbi:hypothetical protein BV22DRAFT_1102356 [Leucogyrophana mollusca]|uniref:Uncharacterized protein n=1 Tax=Leucogyrophana mollusca TaxID=85980 RepID=A0ACB8BV07_9AGAM|nr:hypothetical protein BV22DRAFT_1102356 [Leucogyrophana mollusca]